jgi:hypothetical protein
MIRVPAASLLVPSRLDICSKIPLATAWKNGADERWGRDLYFSYLEKIHPFGGFNQDLGKTTLEDYYFGFRQLFHSIASNGFNQELGGIPLGNKGITNGAHRVAVSVALGLEVSIEKSLDVDHVYDWRFLDEIGLDGVFVDGIMSEFLGHWPNTRIFCLMGLEAHVSNGVEEYLNRNRNVIFRKTISLTSIGQRRLMQILYGANPWWNHSLFETLTLERFKGSTDGVTFVFIEAQSISDDIRLKDQLRRIFLHSESIKKIHSTDTQEEVTRLSDTILNSNSIHFMNYAPIGAEAKVLTRIRQNSEKSNSEYQEFTVDGSSILEMYSIRQANDLDYVNKGNIWHQSEALESHNHEYDTQLIKPSDLLSDPRAFFKWDGLKFMSLPALITFKAFRGEEKDLLDITTILENLDRLPQYSTADSVRKARKFKVMLLLRKNVERLLSHMPNAVSTKFKSTYRYLRQGYRLLK